jgi:o-succinylbenzoate---CoA ligase
MPCPLRAAATEFPLEPAIVRAGGALLYGELDRRVSVAADALGERGIREGTRVAIYLSKDERYFVLLLAILRLGAVACPISTRLPPRAIGPLLEDAGCRALISDDEQLLEGTEAPPGLRPAEVLAERAARDLSEPLHPSMRLPATVVYTSGSTGRPKGALHTRGNHVYSALGSNANITLAPGDRWLHALPLYHVGGLSIVFRCLLARAAIALPEAGVGVGEGISALGATHVSLVATQLLRLLDEDVPLDGLKAILLGGSAVPPSLVARARERGLPVHTSYGLTEMASQVTTTRPGASREELLTSGGVLPHRELSISFEGEILVRGRTLFAGYVEGEGVRLPVDRDGWFHTGDLGVLDTEGRLLVRGRRDNMFVSGGENVQPEEIEAALGAIEGVLTAVVVSVPDPEFGARPVAFVRAGEDVSPDYLATALEEVLPRFAIPTAFHPWPEDIPEGMKPDRALLARLAQQSEAENT